MRNGVAPRIEIFEVSSSPSVPTALGSYAVPKLDAQAIEVGTYVSRVRVALVQLSVKRKFRSKNRLDSGW